MNEQLKIIADILQKAIDEQNKTMIADVSALVERAVYRVNLPQ